MKLHIAIAVTGLLGLGALACNVSSGSLVHSNTTPPRKAEGPEKHPQTYHTVSAAVWEADSRGTKVEAQVTTLNAPLKDAPVELPPSRLTLRNLATNEIIYERSVVDRPISMYTRDLNADSFPELVLTWSKGAVAERLEILSVNPTQAHVLLDEAYRISATFIELNGKTIDVLVTTGESGVEPFYTTRYTLREGQYLAVGKVSYDSLVSAIKMQFNQSQ